MKKIKISHTIEVDKCIAEEIEELNNKHDILTLHSCCGHDKGECGFIAVHPENIKDMLALGYEINGHYETPGTSSETGNKKYFEFPIFTAKSVCKGRC